LKEAYERDNIKKGQEAAEARIHEKRQRVVVCLT